MALTFYEKTVKVRFYLFGALLIEILKRQYGKLSKSTSFFFDGPVPKPV